MEKLHCEERAKGLGHAARRARRNGKVPGILYGEKLNNIMFEISAMELDSELLKCGYHGVIEVDINGTFHKTLIKDIQRDPVNQKPIHIDLEKISDDKTVISDIPVFFKGEEWVGISGGILQKEKGNVKVQCKAEKLPKHIDINLKNCRVGDVIRISDLEIGSDITFMEDLNGVIASISPGNRSMINVDDAGEEEPKNKQ
jgi:large subunit ribosomal protein L25